MRALRAHDVKQIVTGGDDPHERRRVPDVIGEHGQRLVGGFQGVGRHAVHVCECGQIPGVGPVIGIQGGHEYVFGVDLLFSRYFAKARPAQVMLAPFPTISPFYAAGMLDSHGMAKLRSIQFENCSWTRSSASWPARPLVRDDQHHLVHIVARVQDGLDGRLEHFAALVDGGDHDGMQDFPGLEKPHRPSPGTVQGWRGAIWVLFSACPSPDPPSGRSSPSSCASSWCGSRPVRGWHRRRPARRRPTDIRVRRTPRAVTLMKLRMSGSSSRVQLSAPGRISKKR